MAHISEIAAEIWEKLDAPEYHVLAKELARRRDEIDDWAEALRPYAYEFSRRPGVNHHDKKTPAGAPGSADSPRNRGAAGQRNSGRSSKVRQIRETWPELRRQYAISSTQRKALLDMTHPDLVYAAANVERAGRKTIAVAEILASLDGELTTYRVTKVSDLPDAVLSTYAKLFR